MHALHADRIPSTLAAYVSMLVQPRSGLDDPSSMPRIERALEPVTVDRAWLAAYRASVGLPDDGPERLPPLALQIAAAPLHLAILADGRT